MSYYGNNGGHQQGGYQQGGYQQGGGFQQQGGHHQGGYQQDRPPSGEAGSYYGQGQQGQQQFGTQHGYGQEGYGQQQGGYGQSQHQSGPPPYQNQGNYGNQGYRNDGPPGSNGPEGEDGERGLTGALAGGAAGAFGGHKVGGNFGHSKTSTFIGAVAGAFAGHKLQDGVSDWKDKRDEEKKHEHDQKHDHDRPHSPPKDHHHGHHDDRHGDDKPRSGNYGGGFTGSSRDIRLDAHGEYNLHASCKRRDGEWQSSTISLNRILENDHGSFRWSSGGGGGGDSSVTVQQGDTLRNIAARFNVGFEEIARHNNIPNPDQIWPGQVLQIPGRGGNSGGNFGASARDARLVQGGQVLEAELSRNGQWVRSSVNLDERIGNNNGTLHLV
ncbi:CVNH domain-containing protein [Colletotrichum abscissum]|uniref:CVNH domain-containing protein n=2 Tax=Colletotrichum acutatum species complex TaxID=2707335 RepID=A0A9P9XQG7_9PEZI|nr:CVNH domain-containing protein [Colletotrichum tamarilloi]XP_060393903.1 CVNH domain-containing protein [Colletotrichum abscissum]KAI3558054.1 CVNH domain-containing protein [Colletotrichum abscissum]KAK1482877.1 CVNH domain-containing protein [Colletotrichum abscissum]KAK1501982.1 CVNH domain-containing protein [Colletotrichum tamarilloi]